MSSFALAFDAALDAKDDSLIPKLSHATNAFLASTDDARDIVLHLQSDAEFSHKLLQGLMQKELAAKQAQAILDLLFCAMYSSLPITPEFVSRWIDLLEQKAFLRLNDYSLETDAMRESLFAMACLVTLEIVQAAQKIPLDSAALDSDFFFSKPDVMTKLHDFIVAQADEDYASAVLLLEWGSFLHKAEIDISNNGLQESAYQGFFDHVFTDESQQVYKSLIERALELNVYNDVTLLDSCLPRTHADVYKATLLRSVLNVQEYIQPTPATAIVMEALVTSRALSDLCWESPATGRLFNSARQSFPFEHRLFVRLARTLAYSGSRLMAYLEGIPTFTQLLPIGFAGFEVVSSEAGQTLIELNTNLQLFGMIDDSKSIIIERGTRGLMVPAKNGNLVLWQHSYSALQYLFGILQTSARNLTVAEHRDVLEDLIVLFSRLLSDCDDVSEFLRTLQVSSSQSLSSTVFLIYEQALQVQSGVDLFGAIIEYFKTLLVLQPSSAWPFLVRFSFTAKDSNGLAIENYVAGIEASGQACQVVTRVCNLLSAAVSDLSMSALQAGDHLAKAKQHFFRSGTSFALSCFRSYEGWPVGEANSRYNSGAALSTLFRSIVRLVDETQLAACPRTRYIADIISTSNQMIKTHLTTASHYRTPEMLPLRSVLDRLGDEDGTDETTKAHFERAILALYGALLRNAPQTSTLRMILLGELPTLFNLCFDDKHKTYIVEFLLDILQHEPIHDLSILAAFGSKKTKIRQELHAYLSDIATKTEEETIQFWKLITCLLSHDQEGIALFLLESTGEQPCCTILAKIATHLEHLDLETWSPKITIQILTVLLSAQNWAHTVHEQLNPRTSFWRKLYKLCIAFNGPLSNQTDEATIVHEAYRFVGAGLSAKIIATEISCLDLKTRSSSDWTIMQILVALPSAGVFEVKHYRASLHHNLARNLTQKYPDFTLAALRRTKTSIDNYGEMFLHNVDLASRMIRVNSFLRELRIANLNLSIVDAQGHRIQGLQVLLSAATLTPINSTESWLRLCTLTCQLLSQTIEVPMLKTLTLEMTQTAAILCKCLCQARTRSDTDGLLHLLDPFSRQILQSEPNQSLDTARLRVQALLQVLELISDSSFSKSQLPQLERQLVGVFEGIVCSQAVRCVEVLRQKPDLDTIGDMNVLVVVGRLLSRLIKTHQLSNKSFSAILLQTNLVEGLVKLFFGLKPSSSEVTTECAYSIMQLFLMLHEVTAAADQLMQGGVHRLLLESDYAVQIQQCTPRKTQVTNNLWVDGVLPMMLYLANSLGARIKDELEILIRAYSAKFEHSISQWTKPSSIDSSMTQELILTLLLIGTYDNMLPRPDEDYLSTKQNLAERIEYLLRHPKTTSALSVMADQDQAVLQDLQAALDIINDGAVSTP